jgi:hypothetical protein
VVEWNYGKGEITLMRVLVCGDREWDRYEEILDKLTFLQKIHGEFTVVEGEARGADRLAREAAEQLGLPVEPHPAHWDLYGRAAGPIRNQEMLDSGIDLVVAFHSDLERSKGTRHMVTIAEKRGVDVVICL